MKVNLFKTQTPGLQSSSPSSFACLFLAVIALVFAGCGDNAGTSGEGGGPLTDEQRFEQAVEKLGNSDSETRAKGIEDISEFKDKAKDHIGTIVGLLDDSDAKVRQAAINTLVTLEHKDPAFIEKLKAIAAEDESADTQTTALDSLKSVGAHSEFVDACKTLLAGSDAGKREQAAMALSQSEKPVVGAQAELIKALEDDSPTVRYSCVVALGNLGGDASAEAKTALQKASKDKDDSVAEVAKEALGKLN